MFWAPQAGTGAAYAAARTGDQREGGEEPMERPDRWAVLAVLGGVVSIQLGQALGKGLFGMAGPLGVATVRLVIAAILMLVLWRPALPQSGRDRWLILALGTSIAGMSITYLAMQRLPFGVAMTLQLLGPVAVALGASRRAAELGWALLAAASVVLFADPWSAPRPSAAGLAYGLASAAAMALFLILSGRLASRTTGSGGLALATAWAALLYAPLGLLESGTRLFYPPMAGMGTAVAALSVVAPYMLTVRALRRLPLRLVSILTSLEPVVAGLAGQVVLGEHLSATQWVAIGGITVASAGATRSGPRPATPDRGSGKTQRPAGEQWHRRA